MSEERVSKALNIIGAEGLMSTPDDCENAFSLFFPVYNDERTVRKVTEKAIHGASLKSIPSRGQ
jgi:hypothetical protein